MSGSAGPVISRRLRRRRVPLRRRRLSPRLVARSGGRTIGSRWDGAVRGARFLKYIEHPAHFPAPDSAGSGVTPPSGCHGHSGRPTATAGAHRAIRVHGVTLPLRRAAAVADRAVDTGSSSATGWTPPLTPTSRSTPGGRRRGGHRLLLSQHRTAGRSRPVLGRAEDAPPRRACRPDPPRVQRHYVNPTAPSTATPRRCTPWPSCSACLTTRLPTRRGAVGQAGGRGGVPHPDGFRRHPLVTDALTSTATSMTPTGCCYSRSARHGSTPSPWSHHDLGALGLDVADGTINPGEMTVQPLSHSRGGRLDAPGDRGMPRSSPVRAGAHRSTARRRPRLGRASLATRRGPRGLLAAGPGRRLRSRRRSAGDVGALVRLRRTEHDAATGQHTHLIDP